ncbi:unnamed protein product [Caenorhabditis sp. 36 PRJEB53466]|nr:unnamed protein product [Caenorhabditis sp. 36 PRJEB53466]
MKALVLISTVCHVAAAVKCHFDEDSTCDGDFCVGVRRGVSWHSSPIWTCVSGVKKPSDECVLGYDDELVCFCDTDFCNNLSIFRSNVTTLPVIECREVRLREYLPVACNVCIRTVRYEKQDEGGEYEHESKEEGVRCSDDTNSAEFVLDPQAMPQDAIAENFHSDACYNVSMHPNKYNVFCRCSKANCNSPETDIPFPISAPTTSCFVGGLDSFLNSGKYGYAKYEKMTKTDSFADEGLECRGHYCFIATLPFDTFVHGGERYYKGFKLPVHSDNHGRGYVSMPQEHANVNWRCGLLGVEDNKLGIQLMCNQEDRSNFWSFDLSYVFEIKNTGGETLKEAGSFRFQAKTYLSIRVKMEEIRRIATKGEKLIAQFTIEMKNKVGIRPKRSHDYSVKHQHLDNVKIVVEGKSIFCNKQILGLQSEFFMGLLFSEGAKNADEIKLPKEFTYDKVLRLIKVLYNDGDALSPDNVEDTLALAHYLKSDNARQRCERWLSKTPNMPAQKKMILAEKFGLIELQNECIAMLKTSKQVQKLFENPRDFTDTDIAELMNRVTLSIVGQSYDISSALR